MKSFISFLFISLLIISVGCDSTTEPGKEKNLKGIVKDTQGNLLSDVKVFIIYDYGQSALGSSSGTVYNKPISINGVDLYSFTVVLFNSGAKLDWVTLSELNNTGFEIERKTSNSDWEVLVLLRELVQLQIQAIIHLRIEIWRQESIGIDLKLLNSMRITNIVLKFNLILSLCH